MEVTGPGRESQMPGNCRDPQRKWFISAGLSYAIGWLNNRKVNGVKSQRKL